MTDIRLKIWFMRSVKCKRVMFPLVIVLLSILLLSCTNESISHGLKIKDLILKDWIFVVFLISVFISNIFDISKYIFISKIEKIKNKTHRSRSLVVGVSIFVNILIYGGFALIAHLIRNHGVVLEIPFTEILIPVDISYILIAFILLVYNANDMDVIMSRGDNRARNKALRRITNILDSGLLFIANLFGRCILFRSSKFFSDKEEDNKKENS